MGGPQGRGMSRGRIQWSIIATAVVLAGAAIYLLMLSAAIAEQARLYPRIFLLAIVAGSVLLAVSALIETRGKEPSAAGEDGGEESDRKGWPLYMLLLVYGVLLDRLGFVVASLLFLAPVLLWLRIPALMGIPLALAGVLAIFVVFRTAMYVSLPAGPVDIYLLELIYGGWRR
jgi:hypothetical protein